MSEQGKHAQEVQNRGNKHIQDDQGRFYLNSIIDAMQDSVIITDLRGIITSWNRSAESLYGTSEADAIGRPLDALLHQAEFEQLRQSIEKLKSGIVVQEHHILRFHKEGSELQVEFTLSPVLDEEGKVIAVSTIARDTTVLAKTREDLASSQSRLQAMVEAAIDFTIITVDPQGIIHDWSSGAERMFGHSAEEAIGRHTEMLFTPEDRLGGIPMHEIEVARKNGRSIDERWHMHKDGSRFFMSGVMTPLVNGPIEGYVKVGRNITDRKMAEEALYLSEQRKSLAVSSAHMGEWEWDVHSETVQVSRETCMLFGLPAETKNVPFNVLLDLVYAPDRELVKEQVAAALGGLLIFHGDFRIRREDTNETLWLNAYGRVIAHEGNSPSRMIGVVYDITERKHLEKQKDDFISLASHELKTPVTAIKAYSEVLQDVLGESGDEENVVLLRKLNGQVDRLTKLIESLLDSSTITEGKMNLHPETLDINQLIEEQVETYQRIAGNKTIRWMPEPVAFVHADRDRIIQVVTNFVSNAVKYSPSDAEIIISTHDKLDSLMLCVKDNGPGIEKEAQHFLFDRYFRVAGEPRKMEGIGLGLYISAAIIRQHNGAIGVESAPGEGSVFFFTLPYT